MSHDFKAELRRRMSRTQRHRLLQGYPMLPNMDDVAPSFDPLKDLALDDARPLIVGVLPHPFCNPKVRGCGFCTFAHEFFEGRKARALVDAVCREVAVFCERHQSVARRRVDALYFGGGTANLTPPESFARLCRELASHFALEGAEVTLEGVPIYFEKRAELLDRLAALPSRHRRLSMGVQTFDAAQLELMGRTHFGTREQIGRVVADAHRRGMTASCDLLCNLPNQTLAQMRDDVRVANELGFDQVCLYHLVLVEGFDVPWAKSPELMKALPDVRSSYEHWRELRSFLLELGFVQTTLTNFERAAVNATPRRFVYEEHSFTPETYDGLGFGPGGISCFTSASGDRAVKWVNAASGDTYRRDVSALGQSVERHFDYDPTDLRLLTLTRTLPRLAISREAYRERFGSDVFADFPGELEALVEADLVSLDDERLALTERGMFFADSVAGLLAWRRAAALAEAQELASPMG